MNKYCKSGQPYEIDLNTLINTSLISPVILIEEVVTL
jgi:hypothetical protein